MLLREIAIHYFDSIRKSFEATSFACIHFAFYVSRCSAVTVFAHMNAHSLFGESMQLIYCGNWWVLSWEQWKKREIKPSNRALLFSIFPIETKHVPNYTTIMWMCLKLRCRSNLLESKPHLFSPHKIEKQKKYVLVYSDASYGIYAGLHRAINLNKNWAIYFKPKKRQYSSLMRIT